MSPKKKKTPPTVLDRQLSQLEEQAAKMGIHIHYDRLEAEGLKLKDGICKLDGTYHIFVDRRKSMPEKIDIIQEFIDQLVSEVPDGPDE